MVRMASNQYGAWVEVFVRYSFHDEVIERIPLDDDTDAPAALEYYRRKYAES